MSSEDVNAFYKFESRNYGNYDLAGTRLKFTFLILRKVMHIKTSKTDKKNYL